MAAYVVRALSGALRDVRAGRELLHTLLPVVKPFLADAPELLPVLFFVTQDGYDGFLAFEPEVRREMTKDQLADNIRSFCAEHGVKGCGLLATGRATGVEVSCPRPASAQGGVPTGYRRK